MIKSEGGHTSDNFFNEFCDGHWDIPCWVESMTCVTLVFVVSVEFTFKILAYLVVVATRTPGCDQVRGGAQI